MPNDRISLRNNHGQGIDAILQLIRKLPDLIYCVAHLLNRLRNLEIAFRRGQASGQEYEGDKGWTITHVGESRVGVESALN